MRPPSKSKMDFERVQVDTWITGIIEEVKLDAEHKKIYKGKESIIEAVRFKFKLEGYEHPHYTRWMTYNFGEKSNLYLKYLVPLVEGAKPDMKFDLDALQGMAIKTMWSSNGDFDNLEMIRPLKAKVPHDAESESEPTEEETAEEVPF